MPAGAAVVRSGAAVSIAFNSATSAVVAIGINGDTSDYGAAIDISAKGVKTGNLSATDNAIVSADTEVFATLTLTGATTAGSADIFVEYLI